MKTVRIFALLLVVTGTLTLAAKLSGSVSAAANPKMPAYPRESKADLKKASDLRKALAVKPKMPAYPRASNKDIVSNPLAELQAPFWFSPSQGGALQACGKFKKSQ